MRELFQLAVVTLFFGQSEKSTTPYQGHIEIYDMFEDKSPKPLLIVEPQTPPPSGFLPIMFSLAMMLFSLLGDELIWIVATFLFDFFLPPFARVLKRCVGKIGRRAIRALHNLTSHRRVQDGTMSDATTQTQPSAPEIAATTTGDLAALSELRSHHAQEMSTMFVRCSRAAGELRSERKEKYRLLGNLRAAMDPRGFYADTDLEIAADAQARDLDRLQNQIEYKRRQAKAALKKAAETTELSKENWILKGRLESMTCNIEHTKIATLQRERQLRKEVNEITAVATTDTVNIGSYRAQIGTINQLEVALEVAHKETTDKEEEGRVAVEGVRDELTSLQSVVERLTSNQAPDESSQAEGRRALERAIENERTSARKLEQSEKKVSESAATVSQLQQGLSKARDDVRQLSDNDEALRQRLEIALAALEKKQSPAPAAPNAALTSEIESLRSQLKDATSQASEQFQNGYLAAIAQNPPADQGQEASTQTDHEENNGTGPQDEELRSEMEQLKAAKNEVEQKLVSQRSQAEEAMLNERRQAQEWVTAAQAQVRQEATTAYNQQWAVASANHAAEIQRLKNLGRQVEDARNVVAQQFIASQQEVKTLQGQLQEVSENYESAMSRLENPEGDLKASNDVLDTVMARAEAAEEEVKKYQSGKAAQDGRIKDLNTENAALKKNARGEQELAETTAIIHDKIRATALTDELVNRHYDHLSRIAATQLKIANAKIMELKLFLSNSRNRYNQVTCLQILQNAEVDNAYKSLEGPTRIVLTKQCEGVNAKIMTLKAMINGGRKDPKKSELLQEIFNARGDEQAVWDEAEPAPSESSDEDEDDDDDDDNAGEGSSSGAARRPFVPRPLPTSRRPRPTTPAGPPETPLPIDPRPNNALKRKGDDVVDDDNAGEGSSKRNDISDMDMRPQGPPPAEADHQKAPESASPFAEGNTGFTFSVPRDIAIGILPHVRKYSELSGTTNTVDSRHHLLPSNNDNTTSTANP